MPNMKSKQALKLWFIIFVIVSNVGGFLLLTFRRTYTAKLHNEVAEAAGMIPYEIFCNVKRAKFTYSY